MAVEPFSSVKIFFCSNKFAQLPDHVSENVLYSGELPSWSLTLLNTWNNRTTLEGFVHTQNLGTCFAFFISTFGKKKVLKNGYKVIH